MSLFLGAALPPTPESPRILGFWWFLQALKAKKTIRKYEKSESSPSSGSSNPHDAWKFWMMLQCNRYPLFWLVAVRTTGFERPYSQFLNADTEKPALAKKNNICQTLKVSMTCPEMSWNVLKIRTCHWSFFDSATSLDRLLSEFFPDLMEPQNEPQK
jgi:hypothetical protein